MRKILLVLLTLILLFSNIVANASGIVIIGDDAQEVSSLGDYGTEMIPGQKIVEDGNYAIEFGKAILRSDEALNTAPRIGQYESKEDNAELSVFEYQIGTHMPVSLTCYFTNLSKAEINLLKRIQCQIVYDDKYLFDTTPMQINANQKTSDGGYWYSTVGVSIEPLVKADLAFRTALPISIRDSDKPLIAILTIDGTDIYEVDLRKNDAIELY